MCVLFNIATFNRSYQGTVFDFQSADISCMQPDKISKQCFLAELQYKACSLANNRYLIRQVDQEAP